MTQEATAIKTRPVGGQQPSSHWNSPKRQRTLSMSDRGWDIACEMAETTCTNRSEIVEVAIRLLASELGKADFVNLRQQLLES